MDGTGADIEMENDRIKGIVIITKKDIEDPDGDPLPNAGYTVYMNDGAGNYIAVKAIDTGTSTDGIYEISDDGTEEIMYTGSEVGGEYYGMLRIEGLNWGMYYYEEVEAPIGYEVDTEKQFFDVTKDNTHIRNADMTQTETPQKFSETDNQLAAPVTLTKKDAEDGSVLANATFELYVKDKTSGEWSKADDSYYITDDDGTFTAYVKFGTYKFKEITAPSGYKLADNEDDRYTDEFTVTAASTVTGVSISMDNERKTGSAQLYKTDPDGVTLSGAIYNLYRTSDDELIAEDLTTDSTGYTFVVEGLTWGSYYFLETEPPLHHELSTEKIEVTISASTVEVTQIVTAVDQHKKGSVEIIKMDDGKNYFLEGAVFSLYSSDGTLIQEGITTDADGHAKIENLEWGSYYLIETEAPTNYLVYDGQVNFSVGADTCEIVQPVYCYDEPNLYRIIIDKELLMQYEEYGKGTFLFKITCTSGQDEGKVLYRAIDMSNSLTGSVTVTGLYAGTYVVEEVSTTRYGLSETEDVYGFTINGDTGETTLSDALEEAEIKFTNDIQNWEKDNHEVYVQNSVQKMRLPVSLEVTWLGPDTIESDTASEYFFTADDLTAVVSFDNDTSENVAFSDLEFSPEWIDGSMNGSAVTVVVSYTVNGITVSDTFNVAVKLQAPLQSFRLIYDGNGGTIDGNAQNAVTYKWNPKNLEQELQSGSYTEPSRVGYSFTGWYLNADGTGDTFDSDSFLAEKRDTDLTVYAAWQINSYTASFDSNGGSTVSTTITKVYNTALGTLPADPTRTGYTFAGWYTAATGGTSVTEDTLMPGYNPTYYAHWTVNSYTLTFDANGGSTASPKTITKNYGTAIGTLPTTSRTGYTFNGWYTAESGGTKLSASDTMPAANKTYYAQWTINTFTVTLNPQSGTISSWSGGSQSGTNWVKTYDYNTTLGTLPTPTRSGYDFDGWYTAASGGTAYSSSTKVTADQTYYAHWSQQTVTVYICISENAYADSSLTTSARDAYANLYGMYITRT
ncbi:MAG: InlB B-repeat-containing protein, partial [Clostridiales bacterium]|nr:InlB B-repeat-containing protein [Clostridiales bacterium]